MTPEVQQQLLQLFRDRVTAAEESRIGHPEFEQGVIQEAESALDAIEEFIAAHTNESNKVDLSRP